MTDANPARPVQDPMLSKQALAVLIALVAAAVVAFYFGFSNAKTGIDSVSVTGGLVEFTIPPEGSTILKQDNVGVSLAQGYEAELEINGRGVPLDELTYDPSNNSYIFRPGPDKFLDELPPRNNCVTAIYWSTLTGRITAERKTFCFLVSA